jgi:hypothetical protein
MDNDESLKTSWEDRRDGRYRFGLNGGEAGPRVDGLDRDTGRSRIPRIPRLADTADDLALGPWVLTSVLGIALGLVTAKYSQPWARHAIDPSAVMGALVVVVSVALTIVAVGRYLAIAASRSQLRGPPRALAVLAASLVVMLGWVALAIIGFVGWELPPVGPR